MATVTDLAFSMGDLQVIEVAPGIFDYAIVEDNEALSQGAGLGLDTQLGWNQYEPDAGWNRARYIKGALTVDEIHAICFEVKRMLESVDFVQSATCQFIGTTLVGAQIEFVFFAQATTELGPLVLPFALGGTSGV